MSSESHSSGFLLVDKPKGVTSHDVVDAARRALGTKRVGHAGTLDPMATGMLVLGFGQATRLLPYASSNAKVYDATIRLGQTTRTEDAEGDVTASVDASGVTREAVEQAIAEHLTGTISQVPSSYSAIKIAGRHAYDLARDGQDVTLEPRDVDIRTFTVHAMRDAMALDGTAVKDVDVTVECSDGTYIRALARDLGALLNVGGHLTMLRRTRVGNFSVDDTAVVSAHTEEHTYTNRAGETVTRAKAVFDMPADDVRDHAIAMSRAAANTIGLLSITESQAKDLRMGRRIQAQCAGEGYIAAIDQDHDDVVAIVTYVDGSDMLQPVTVFAQGEHHDVRGGA